MYSRTRDELEHMTDFSAFEDLCNLLLSRIGYEGIDPQGIQGRDGGKDSILRRDDTTVFHYSLRSDWEAKLDDDLDTVKEHVQDRDFDCDRFVFATNEFIGGEKKGDKKNAVEDEYGWEFELIDGYRIQSELDSHHLDLRKKFFSIEDDGPEQRLMDEVESWRSTRLERIQNNDGLSVNFESSPAVVLHIVPRDFFVGSVDIQLNPEDRLKPISVKEWDSKPFADGVTGWAPNEDGRESRAYTDLYHDGRIEAALRLRVMDRGDSKLINGNHIGDSVYESLDEYLEKLDEKGVEPPFYLCLSLFGVQGLSIGIGGWRGSTDPNQQFSKSTIRCEPVEIGEYDADIEEELSEPVDRIWRAAGHWHRM